MKTKLFNCIRCNIKPEYVEDTCIDTGGIYTKIKCFDCGLETTEIFTYSMFGLSPDGYEELRNNWQIVCKGINNDKGISNR